ncbi:MAG: hypothetical protein BGO98_33965 [Myxococcales bacterium 68-20]|nr:MAG: hypothetical protein BGO98_33965 [Myxococcales bacterium 68-20]
MTLFARRTAGAVGLVGSVFLICDCTSSSQQLGFVEDPAPPVLTDPDAGRSDGAATEEGLISYCPSSQCPPGWTTCPDSRFPCDTNILADSKNCGGCGRTCATSTGPEQFTCSGGACKMECVSGFGFKDCDGVVDNGCESDQRDPLNCGACGVACAVGEHCIWQDDELKLVGCGCPPGKVACPSCRDLSEADSDCGACNNACDPTGGPDARQYSNTYYGCGSGECGKLKCRAPFANCDGDVENGCEVSLATDDNCGDCGNKCGAGQRCGIDLLGGIVNGRLAPSCVCGPGLTFCQTGEELGLPKGYCVDVSGDVDNCGACGNRCEVFGGGYGQTPVCDFGKCVLGCRDGWADCNGSQVDGCEIDTRSDPRNCGGCGITCDLTLGQACVAGKCVVEPCDQGDAGEVTR